MEADVDPDTAASFVNMTIDAGVVPVDPDEPDEPDDPDDPDNPDTVQPQDPGWLRGIPTTGSNSVMSLLLTALRLLIVGGGLVVIDRRRRTSLESR
jgi:LPXTG-motif cell wall-anchored protein